MVNVDRCDQICNTLDGLTTMIFDHSDGLCVLKETFNVYVKVFSMITGINDSKRLIKRISCNGRCRFDSKKRNNSKM